MSRGTGRTAGAVEFVDQERTRARRGFDRKLEMWGVIHGYLGRSEAAIERCNGCHYERTKINT